MTSKHQGNVLAETDVRCNESAAMIGPLIGDDPRYGGLWAYGVMSGQAAAAMEWSAPVRKWTTGTPYSCLILSICQKSSNGEKFI